MSKNRPRWYLCDRPARNNGLLKIEKKKTLLGTFFLKAKEVKKLILKLLENISKIFLLLENSIKTG